MPDCSIVQKSWSQLTTDELYGFLKLRTDVFLVEQKVDDEELDDRDREASAEHFWLADETGCFAYLRVLLDEVASHLDAHRVVGRVTVRADRRGEGHAQALLAAVLERFGTEPLMLHAQEYIVPLYAKIGFVPFGEVYQEAGLPHLSMYRPGVR